MEGELKNNLEGYEILLKIEIGIREFIIDRFNESCGNTNWMQLGNGIFPDKLINKIVEMRSESACKGWNSDRAKTAHGIYYLLFTDLKEIIQKKDYLVDGSKMDIFKLNNTKKNSLVNSMESIFSIRNAIAHSIIISNQELKILKSYIDICHEVIPSFYQLINRPIFREKANDKYLEKLQQIMNLICKKEDIGFEFEELNVFLDKNGTMLNLNAQYLEFIKKYWSLKRMVGKSIEINNLISDNRNLIDSLNHNKL